MRALGTVVYNPDPSNYPWIKSFKANFVYFVISIVLPGGIVQGLRVTLTYICRLAKGKLLQCHMPNSFHIMFMYNIKQGNCIGFGDNGRCDDIGECFNRNGHGAKNCNRTTRRESAPHQMVVQEGTLIVFFSKWKFMILPIWSTKILTTTSTAATSTLEPLGAIVSCFLAI